MLIAEDEYETEESLPAFAAKHLSHHFSVSYCFGSATDRNKIIGVEDVATADALLVSVRRRALPPEDLELIRDFVARGKPVIGIRTASHAFSLRDQQPPEGLSVWPEFDAEVFGGNYTNHYGNGLAAVLELPAAAGSHAILRGTDEMAIKPRGSLYKTAPLAAGSSLLLLGKVPEQEPEPVAWTYIRSDGGRSFYTSLGHPGDFEQAAFEALLSAGIHWACTLDVHPQAEVQQQNERYAAGQGRQR